MNHLLGVTLSLGAMLLGGSPHVALGQQKEQMDQEKMQGEWKIAKWEVLGDKPPKDYKSWRVVIKGNTYRVLQEGKRWPIETFKLDTSKSSKAIDLTTTFTLEKPAKVIGSDDDKEKPGKKPPQGKKSVQVTLKGIYDIKGDTMIWCFSFNEFRKRPSTFAIPKEGGVILWRMQRLANVKE
jgi:uncharacterized protein (TIGR03067 family)